MKLIPIGWLLWSTSIDFKIEEVFRTFFFFFWLAPMNTASGCPNSQEKSKEAFMQSKSTVVTLVYSCSSGKMKRGFSHFGFFFSRTHATWLCLELNLLLSCWKPKPWMQILWWLSTRFLSLTAETSLKICPHFVMITWQILLVLKFWWAVCMEVWLVC